MREVREIRLRRGLSQADLSAMTGVAEFTISEIESGKRANPRHSTLRKLARGLGVEVTDLYGEVDSPLGQARSSQEKLFNNGVLEDERRATIRAQLASWRGMHEESAARWARALEREPAFDSVDAAAAFCAEIIAEGAVGQTIITRDLIPQAGKLLPEDEAAQERQDFLETHALLGEGMSTVIDVVEGLVDSEADADAASKAIGRYLDQAVSRAIDDTREERHDRPDLELWLRRERRRRQQAGAQTKAKASSEGNRKRPPA